MPTYEFRCPQGHEFEKFFRKISDATAEQSCPSCGMLAERRMSAGALVFKGSGFYITDYARAGKEGGAEDAPAEKKPAAPAEAKPGAVAAPTPEAARRPPSPTTGSTSARARERKKKKRDGNE